jgi:hypothetical protein
MNTASIPHGAVLLAFLLACSIISPRCQAQATTPATGPAESSISGPLQIHVTAAQGGAQFRTDAASRWHSVVAGSDFIEGVEFRTGPKGTVQFTVGTDQVFRVDRLTAVKVLRANLNPDGTIRTDVGMTYGRVSKDVDEPSHPHQDTIVSPSSTLAVRGTRVSLYDQPPFAPEAVSLTGAAIYHNVHGPLVHLGAKGSGLAKVADGSNGAAQYQIESNVVDPNGLFSGRSGSEYLALQSALGGLTGTELGVFQSASADVGGAQGTAVIGSIPVPGELFLYLSWNSSTLNTVVNFSVTTPTGQVISMAHTPADASFNPSPGESNTAPMGFGTQEVDIGTINSKIAPGTYTIHSIFEGIVGSPLTPTSPESISESVSPNQTPPGGFGAGPSTFTFSDNITLDGKNPSESFKFKVPIANNEPVTEISHSGKTTVFIP